MTATEIRARMRKALGQVAQQLAMVREQDDEQFPLDYRLTRQLKRAELIRQWQTIEGRYADEMMSWAQQALAAAQALYESDPIGTPQEESRRVAENLEIANLAAPLIGQPRPMVQNHLLPEARRLLALNNPAKARLYLEAAKRCGVIDSRLDDALAEAFDRAIPHRREGRKKMAEAELQRDAFDNDRVSMRIAHGVGDQVRNSTEAKLLAFRRGEQVPAGLLGGAHAEGQLHKAARDAGTTE